MVITLVSLVSLPVNAELTQISAYVKGHNECNNYFNDPAATNNAFENCNIFEYNAVGEYVEISPVIAKFDVDGNSFEASDLYDGEVAKSDWGFNGGDTNPGSASSGSWGYDDGDGASSYPGITFWSAKAGNGFNLFWKVDSTELEAGGECAGGDSYLTLSCLQVASVVLGGTWTTPGDKGLSHLIFYNSAEAATCTDDCTTTTTTTVPEPSMILLFLSGLFGFAVRRRTS